MTLLTGYIIPINTVLASDATENVEITKQSTDTTMIDSESESLTLQTMLDNSNMSISDKITTTNTFLTRLKYEFNTRSMPRSRYYTIHQDLSRTQVKKIANSGNKVATLGGLLPGSIGISAGLIYGNYYGMFTKAAINGWGIRITITSDSYNPTSTGTTFNVSYLK